MIVAEAIGTVGIMPLILTLDGILRIKPLLQVSHSIHHLSFGQEFPGQVSRFKFTSQRFIVSSTGFIVSSTGLFCTRAIHQCMHCAAQSVRLG